MGWNGKPPTKIQDQIIPSSPPPPKAKPSIKQESRSIKEESRSIKEEKTDLFGLIIITKLFDLW